MEDLQYVGFWPRFWAVMVDTLILMMIIYPIFYLIYGDDFVQQASGFTLQSTLINYVLPFFLILILWHYKSATPGKMIINSTIVDARTYDKPSTKQFVIRNLGYIVSLIPFGLGYFWAAWDKQKQTWHDKMANTVVVQPKKEKKPASPGSYLAIGMGVFALGAFGILVIIGTMLQTGMMPDGDLYDAEKLSQSVKETFVEKGLVSSEDSVKYYQPDATFSFTKKGTLFTKKSIIYFETQGNDETLVWNFPLRQIGKLELQSQKYALNIEIITLSIYNEQGEIDFAMGLTPRDANKSLRFQKELLSWWESARK
ncbi:MAG: hypothetical protein GQ531_07675 [Sulfurovum sp.]|nr:hypothetical protein [Sulfurovum sp.]